MRVTNQFATSMGSSAYFRGGNTLKNLLMFPKDKEEMKKKSNIIYGIDVAGLNVMRNSLGNLPEPLMRDLKSISRHHHPSMSMTSQLATKHQWRTLE